MSESAPVFNHGRTVIFPTENVHGIVEQPPLLAQGSKRKQPSQQQRQLLSCTKCRERKVKVSCHYPSDGLLCRSWPLSDMNSCENSAIVRNHAQHAARGERPSSASSRQKVVTMRPSNNRTNYVSSARRTFVSRNFSLPAGSQSTMKMLRVQLLRNPSLASVQ
jgi:hypothetical protein